MDSAILSFDFEFLLLADGPDSEPEDVTVTGSVAEGGESEPLGDDDMAEIDQWVRATLACTF